MEGLNSKNKNIKGGGSSKSFISFWIICSEISKWFNFNEYSFTFEKKLFQSMIALGFAICKRVGTPTRWREKSAQWSFLTFDWTWQEQQTRSRHSYVVPDSFFQTRLPTPDFSRICASSSVPDVWWINSNKHYVKSKKFVCINAHPQLRCFF